MRYKEPEKIQNKKCYLCKFCLYFKDYSAYRCSIKGCYQNSKYKMLNLSEWIKESEYFKEGD